jgi:hypothetical protein
MITTARLLAAALLLTALPAAPLAAKGSPKSASLELAKQADKLKPGEWLLYPEIARDGPVLVYVDLGRQRATVYRNGVRIGVSTISSGKPGNSTPTGVFTILQKNKVHFSSTYDNAPMPYMQRLTWKGVALHAGNLPGYPASHGCVRLPLEFAKRLFDVTEMGGTVVIAGGHEDPVNRPVAGVLAPPMAGVTPVPAMPIAPDQTFTWNEAASGDGPTSIIISTGDQQVVVLRNGIEIGRAKAVVAQQTTEAQVLTLTGGNNPHWIQVGMADLSGEPAEVISTERVEQMRLPAEFAKRMRAAMKPGTTVLVTQASVTTDTTGREQTVMDAGEDKEGT